MEDKVIRNIREETSKDIFDLIDKVKEGNTNGNTGSQSSLDGVAERTTRVLNYKNLVVNEIDIFRGVFGMVSVIISPVS